jgi:hypothetical protein
MGWKISALIIEKKYDKEPGQITGDLGLGKSVVDREISLRRSLYPNGFCIGFYNENTIITHPSILTDFFDENPSIMEERFLAIFNDVRIIAVGQIEGAGINGFSFIRNGKRIRTRLVGDEEGEIRNFGDKLEFENGLNDYDLPFHVPGLILGKQLDADDVLATRMWLLKIIE